MRDSARMCEAVLHFAMSLLKSDFMHSTTGEASPAPAGLYKGHLS